MSLSTSLKTGRSLFLLQLISRLITFILNSSLLRLSTPEVLGTASIQFDLISATILFLSREGIRNALLRGASHTSSRLARVPLLLGLVVAAVVVSLYIKTSSLGTTTQTDFYPSLTLYVLAALIELSIEPFYIRCLTSSPPQLGVRVQAEGLMAITKAVVTFTLLYRYPHRALLGFGIGQFCANTVLALRYVYEYGFWVAGRPTDSALVKLAVANTRQSLIKHLLTEADRIAVGRISPLADQGGYAIAMNYGSLIARIVFQPIEETLLLHFSASPQDPSNPALIAMLAHLSAHLSILLPAFVPPMLPPILSILLPRRYLATSAPLTLTKYLSFYIPLLSLNGILEAFHAATASPSDMTRQARFMIASSAVFVATLFVVKAHVRNETALIGASCAGMLVRIAYALSHARRVANITLASLPPITAVNLTVLVSGLVLRRTRYAFSLGCLLGLASLGVIWTVERRCFKAFSPKSQ